MANWTAIADATLEPGKPIRAIDARALRDNPIAIAEGASGAPKIQTAGITDLNVTTAKIADLNVTTAKIADANVTTAKLASGEQMTTANVLGATAGAAVNAVGTYAFLQDQTNSNTDLNEGSTVAGSNLRFSSLAWNDSTARWEAVPRNASAPSGTWRLMGYGARSGGGGVVRYVTLFLRIS